jgi:hypothetical protein
MATLQSPRAWSTRRSRRARPYWCGSRPAVPEDSRSCVEAGGTDNVLSTFSVLWSHAAARRGRLSYARFGVTKGSGAELWHCSAAVSACAQFPPPMTSDSLEATATNPTKFVWAAVGDCFAAGEGAPETGIADPSNHDAFTALSWGNDSTTVVPNPKPHTLNGPIPSIDCRKTAIRTRSHPLERRVPIVHEKIKMTTTVSPATEVTCPARHRSTRN